jgi:hypothetical protein
VIAAAFDEAEARDPGHRRTWVVLVDGAEHQLGLIRAEAVLTLRAVISNSFTLSSHLSGLTCRESKSGKMPRAARGLPRMSVAGSKRRPAAKPRHVAAGLPVSRFWLPPGP